MAIETLLIYVFIYIFSLILTGISFDHRNLLNSMLSYFILLCPILNSIYVIIRLYAYIKSGRFKNSTLKQEFIEIFKL